MVPPFVMLDLSFIVPHYITRRIPVRQGRERIQTFNELRLLDLDIYLDLNGRPEGQVGQIELAAL